MSSSKQNRKEMDSERGDESNEVDRAKRAGGSLEGASLLHDVLLGGSAAHTLWGQPTPHPLLVDGTYFPSLENIPKTVLSEKYFALHSDLHKIVKANDRLPKNQFVHDLH